MPYLEHLATSWHSTHRCTEEQLVGMEVPPLAARQTPRPEHQAETTARLAVLGARSAVSLVLGGRARGPTHPEQGSLFCADGSQDIREAVLF